MANIQEVKGVKGTKYRALVRLKGCPPQSATFARKTDAKKWAADSEAAIRDGRYFKTAEAKRHTVAEMVDRYVSNHLDGKKASEDTVRHLQYWKAEIGSRLLSDVTPGLIGSIRDRLKSEPYFTGEKVKTERYRTVSTVNRYMAAFGHCLTVAAKEWHWIESNPMRNVMKSQEPAGRVRFLSDDERSALLEACQESNNPYLYTVVILALSTGMRQGEIMGLTWGDVDLDTGRAVLHETKNGSRRAVPLTGKVLELLKSLQEKRRPDSELVFPGIHALNRGPASLRTAWLFALKKAGIADFRFHDLRHSCASYLAMNGAPLLDIAAILGHKTLAMVQRYSHLSDTHVRNVVQDMNDKIFGG